MSSRKVTPGLAGVFAVAIAFRIYQAANVWTNVSFGVGMLFWAVTPYVAAFVVGLLTARPITGIVPMVLALVIDVYTLFEVRTSHGSTASLAFLWMPLWDLIIVVPVGAIGAYLWARSRDARQSAL